MGYTVFWEPQHFCKAVYDKAIFDIKQVIDPTLIKIEDSYGFGFRMADMEDDESFVISSKYYSDYWFVKTNRLPYTKDVMMSLIIMVEYGMVSNLKSDDETNENFIDALNTVKSIIPNLLTYDVQLQYFMENKK